MVCFVALVNGRCTFLFWHCTRTTPQIELSKSLNGKANVLGACKHCVFYGCSCEHSARGCRMSCTLFSLGLAHCLLLLGRWRKKKKKNHLCLLCGFLFFVFSLLAFSGAATKTQRTKEKKKKKKTQCAVHYPHNKHTQTQRLSASRSTQTKTSDVKPLDKNQTEEQSKRSNPIRCTKQHSPPSPQPQPQVLSGFTTSLPRLLPPSKHQSVGLFPVPLPPICFLAVASCERVCDRFKEVWGKAKLAPTTAMRKSCELIVRVNLSFG